MIDMHDYIKRSIAPNIKSLNCSINRLTTLLAWMLYNRSILLLDPDTTLPLPGRASQRRAEAAARREQPFFFRHDDLMTRESGN
jgi:hypothetical protein